MWQERIGPNCRAVRDSSALMFGKIRWKYQHTQIEGVKSRLNQGCTQSCAIGEMALQRRVPDKGQALLLYLPERNEEWCSPRATEGLGYYRVDLRGRGLDEKNSCYKGWFVCAGRAVCGVQAGEWASPVCSPSFRAGERNVRCAR
jgi:hypothetical protein